MDHKIKADSLVILFLIMVQAVSLVIALDFTSQEIELVEGGAGVETSILFFILIIFATILLMAIIKLNISKYLYIFTDYFGLFFISLFIVSSVLENTIYGLVAASALTLIKYVGREKSVVGLLSSFILCAGIASIIGMTFGPVPLIMLLLLLSIYDFVAVKKTKHMIRMAEDVIKEKGPQLLTFSSKDEEIVIGLADIIFPSALFVSVYIYEGLAVSLLTSLASIIGLILMFRRPLDEGMPAIPFISLGIVGYLIGILIL